MIRNYYYLTEDGGVLRVRAKKRPGPNTIPRGDTWSVSEYDKETKAFVMFAAPEITWGTLKKTTLSWSGSGTT